MKPSILAFKFNGHLQYDFISLLLCWTTIPCNTVDFRDAKPFTHFVLHITMYSLQTWNITPLHSLLFNWTDSGIPYLCATSILLPLSASQIISSFSAIVFPMYILYFSLMFHTKWWTKKWIPIMWKIQLNIPGLFRVPSAMVTLSSLYLRALVVNGCDSCKDLLLKSTRVLKVISILSQWEGFQEWARYNSDSFYKISSNYTKIILSNLNLKLLLGWNAASN